MTGPADGSPWFALRRRSYAGPPSARLRGTVPVGCTPLPLPQDGWRFRRRGRDPSAETEEGPADGSGRPRGGSGEALRDLQETFDNVRRPQPLRFFLVELL